MALKTYTKYRNQKYYSSSDRSYVKSDDLMNDLASGHEIRVFKAGKNITRETLENLAVVLMKRSLSAASEETWRGVILNGAHVGPPIGGGGG